MTSQRHQSLDDSRSRIGSKGRFIRKLETAPMEDRVGRRRPSHQRRALAIKHLPWRRPWGITPETRPNAVD